VRSKILDVKNMVRQMERESGNNVIAKLSHSFQVKKILKNTYINYNIYYNYKVLF